MSNLKLDHVPPLEGTRNYQEWSKNIRYTLLSEDLWTYISKGTNPLDLLQFGTIAPKAITAKSSEDDVARAHTFMINDTKANSVICRRLSPLVFSNIPSRCNNLARETWKYLKSTYDHIDPTAQFALHTHVTSLRLKDAPDVERFLGEFNSAREQFASMDAKYTDSEAIFQMLVGILDTGTWAVFKQITLAAMSAVSAKEPITFEQVATRLVAESQHIIATSPLAVPGSEFANVVKDGGSRPIRKHRNNPMGVICWNCSKTSHNGEHCFAEGGGMVGQKPEWMIQRDATRKPSSTTSSTDRPRSDVAATRFTDCPRPETAHAILDSSNPGFDLALTQGDLSCASTEFSFLARHILSALLDSGTTSHIVKDRSHFWSFDPTQVTGVKTANHGMLETFGRGDCVARIRWHDQSCRVHFCDCLHAPSTIINLLSVGRLVEHGFGCNFDDGMITIRTPQPGRPICFQRHLENRLGFINIEFLPPPHSSVGPMPELSTFVKTSPSRDLWHARLAYAGETAVQLLSSQASGISLTGAPFSTCEACIVGKHAHAPHPQSSSCMSCPLELVHCDICGPYPIQTPHGKLYFIAFLDDHSHALNLQLLASKDQALSAFQIIHPRWERQFGQKLLALRSDNAGELVGAAFSSYLQQHGISHQLAVPYSHQQNGHAERVICTIQGCVLSMMAAIRAPCNLWGEAALACAHVFMLTPSRALPNNVSPHEAVTGCPPNVSHLQVWGVPCYARVPLELQTKLGPRSHECTFMGYPDGVKGYHVRNHFTGAFFNACNVIFNESCSVPQPSAPIPQEPVVLPLAPLSPSVVLDPDRQSAPDPSVAPASSESCPQPPSTRHRVPTVPGDVPYLVNFYIEIVQNCS